MFFITKKLKISSGYVRIITGMGYLLIQTGKGQTHK